MAGNNNGNTGKAAGAASMAAGSAAPTLARASERGAAVRYLESGAQFGVMRAPAVVPRGNLAAKGYGNEFASGNG